MRIITENDTMRAYQSRLERQNRPPSGKPENYGLGTCANCGAQIPGCETLCCDCYIKAPIKPHWMSEEERIKTWPNYRKGKR
jgi:hypothetical protein